MRYHHTTPEEIKAKYRNLLDGPKAREMVAQPMSREDILRSLDSKYLIGELPLELYKKLRAEYECPSTHSETKKEKTASDPAYR